MKYKSLYKMLCKKNIKTNFEILFRFYSFLKKEDLLLKD